MFINIHPQAVRGRRSGIDGQTLQVNLSKVNHLDVNVLAHFWTIKAFMPDMITLKKGHIVNVASLAGHSGMTKLVDYCR